LIITSYSQIKKFQGRVSIEEFYAALAYYLATRKTLVIVSHRFTRPALELANILGVECWDCERLLTELQNHGTN